MATMPQNTEALRPKYEGLTNLWLLAGAVSASRAEAQRRPYRIDLTQV